jgi:tetratricopeptide (TPR) repeat protein
VVRNYRRMGSAHFDEARKFCTFVIDADDEASPVDPVHLAEAHAEVGRMFYEEGLPVQAQRAYESSIKANPESINATLGKALIDIGEGRVVEGAAVLDSLDDLSNDQARFLETGLTVSLDRIGTRQVLIAEGAKPHAAYAQLLIRVSRNFEAMLAIEHALMDDDTQFAWFNLLGGLAMQQGYTDRAVAAYQRSLVINTDQPRTRQLLEQLTAG